MARMSQQKFLAQLQSGKLIPAILLLGDEPYLRDACRAELIEKFVPEGSRMWGVSRYSADRGEIEQALGAAQMLPMLAQQQVIFIEDLERIEKLGEKNREATVDAISAYLENPAPFTALVLEAKSLDQRMKLGKLLLDRALVVEVGLGDDPEARLATATALAETFAREENVKLESGAAEDLAEFVSGDLLRLRTEIRKLATYAAERKSIRREDVSLLVISEKTSTAWELADMLAARASGTCDGIPRTHSAPRRRARDDFGRAHVDVSQADRSRRREGRLERISGSARVRNASGESGNGAAQRAQNRKASAAYKVCKRCSAPMACSRAALTIRAPRWNSSSSN